MQSEWEHAAQVLKRYIYSLYVGIAKVFWVRLTEWHGYGGIDPVRRFSYYDHTGLIHNANADDGHSHRKLGYYTYRLMTRLLEDADWKTLRLVSSGANGTSDWCFEVSKNETTPLWVIWRDGSSSTEPFTLQVGSEVGAVRITKAIPRTTDSSGSPSGSTMPADCEAAFDTETRLVRDGSVVLEASLLPAFVEPVAAPLAITNDLGLSYRSKYWTVQVREDDIILRVPVRLAHLENLTVHSYATGRGLDAGWYFYRPSQSESAVVLADTDRLTGGPTTLEISATDSSAAITIKDGLLPGYSYFFSGLDVPAGVWDFGFWIWVDENASGSSPLRGLCDFDGDLTGDAVDNCPSTANSDQSNTDGDRLGDACDHCPADHLNDVDRDGMCGDVDNCPSIAYADETCNGLDDDCDGQIDEIGCVVCGGMSCATSPVPLPNNIDQSATWDPCTGGAFEYSGSIHFEPKFDALEIGTHVYNGFDVGISGSASGPVTVRAHTDYSVPSHGILSLTAICLAVACSDGLGIPCDGTEAASPFGFHPGNANNYEYLKDLGGKWSREGMYIIWTWADRHRDGGSHFTNVQPPPKSNGLLPPVVNYDTQWLGAPEGVQIVANICPFRDGGEFADQAEKDTYASFVRRVVERFDGDDDNGCELASPNDCFRPGDGQHPTAEVTAFFAARPIKHWQLCNQLTDTCDTSLDNWNTTYAAKFAEAQRLTYQAVKEADPSATVLMAGDSPLNQYPAVFQELSNQCSEITDRCLEIVDYHRFGKQSSYDPRADFDYLKENLESAGFDTARVRFWITETGTYSGEPVKLGKPMLRQTEQQQAAGLLQTYASALANGIEKVFWAWNIVEGFAHDCGIFDYTGLVYDGCDCTADYQYSCESSELTDDLGKGVKKLSYYTYKKMVEMLEGSRWDNVQTLPQASDGVFLIRFEKAAGPVWVAWNDNAQSVQVTISGISSNRVRITESIPRFKTGKEVEAAGYTAAFNVETREVTNDVAVVPVGEIPLFVEPE
ncbi:MAG: thrombospondin type 3 repeat-containing protein [Pseudomonadota bacterium]